MSFDFLGQLFGKSRRRQLEGEAANLVKPIAVALPIISSRLAAVGLASLFSAALKGDIPHDAHTAAAAGAGALSAIILATPDAFQASGLVRPVSPGTASLWGAVASVVKTAVAAPANAKRAALSSAVQDELRTLTPTLVNLAAQQVLRKTGQYDQSDLSQTDLGGPGNAPAAPANPQDLPAQEPPTPVADSAVALTGGNQ